MPTSDMEYLHKSGKVSYEQHSQMWTEMCARHQVLVRMLGEKHSQWACDCVDIVLEMHGLLGDVMGYRTKKWQERVGLKEIEIHAKDIFPFG